MKKGRVLSAIAAVFTAFSIIGFGLRATEAANPTLTVDMASRTGAVKHGSAGFLYGLGSDGVPSANTLTPLKPHTAVQKAPDGLQHPTGDVLDTAKTFISAGGRFVQVYLQDIYALWPYEYKGFDDYLERIKAMVPKIKALRESDSSFSGKLVYIPFNEPDGIWYSNIDSSTSVQSLFNRDWFAAYTAIKALDPDALIGGVSYASYRSNAMESWIKFCAQNNCLPDIVTWHELQADKLSAFQSHLQHYRSLEKKYGTGEREVVINEYAPQDHCSVPGKLVSWIALFEENKVSGCLPYWHNAGNLNDLAADNNEPNGAWWLYKWYGDMSGETLSVTSTTSRSELYGLASVDDKKMCATVLFGGVGGSAGVVLKNIGTNPPFAGAEKVHVKVEATYWTAFHGAAPEPEVVLEGTYPVKAGSAAINIDGMDGFAAYRLTVTRAGEGDEPGVVYRGAWRKTYEAENASLVGNARITSEPWTYARSGGYRVNYMDTANDGFDMEFGVPADGYYKLDMVYGNGYGLNTQNPSANNPRTVRHTLSIDGSSKIIALENTLRWAMSGVYSEYLYLSAGAHTLSFRGAVDTPQGASVDCISFTYAGAEIPVFDKTFEAELGDFNMLSGRTETSVKTESDVAGFSGSGYVTGLDQAAVAEGGGVRFTVVVDEGGLYNLELRYSAEEAGSARIYLDNTALDLDNLLTTVPTEDTDGAWKTVARTVFLKKGINIIDADMTAPAALDYLRVKKVQSEGGGVIRLEAEDGELAGGAAAVENGFASGGKYVSKIKGGTGDALTLTVNAPSEGEYKMVIYHSNGELFGAHDYNAQLVDRYASVQVNGGEPVRLYFKNTYSDENFRPLVLGVRLNAGENKIKIYNDNYRILTCGTGTADNIKYETLVNYAPNFDRFEFAPSVLPNAAAENQGYKITVRATDGGTAYADRSTALAGETVNLIIRPDNTAAQVHVLANGTDVTSRLVTDGGAYRLEYTVDGDVEFAVRFTMPENKDGCIANSSFGTGDLSGWTAAGQVSVRSEVSDRYVSQYYAKAEGSAELSQTVCGLPDGWTSLFVTAKGEGRLTLKAGGSEKSYDVTSDYRKYEIRAKAAGGSLEVGARAEGTIFLDDFELSNAHIDEGILYFVDAGDSDPTTLSEGDRFGVLNSVTEQFFAPDPVTGMSWGIDDTYVKNPNYPTLLTGALTWPYEYDTSDGRDKVLSYRYAKDQDNMNPRPGVTYKFELPDGEYSFETAFYAPSSWMGGSVNRKCHITINGSVTEAGIIPETDSKNPITVVSCAKITGGFATLGVALDSDGYGGPVISYIIVRERKSAPKAYLGLDLSNCEKSGTPSWNNVPATTAQYAFDGNAETFFDGLVGGWCQVDLGRLVDISQIGYVPRAGFESRMAGGAFCASKDGSTWTKLYVVPSTPASGVETKAAAEKFLTGDTLWRYVRYTCANDYANVAEIRIYENADFVFEFENADESKFSLSAAYIDGGTAYIECTANADAKAFVAGYENGSLKGVVTGRLGSGSYKIPLPESLAPCGEFRLFIWDPLTLQPYIY